MAKWYGVIGYSTTVESEDNPGVWVPDLKEQPYYGDISTDYRKRQNGTGTNDDIDLTNMLSIIADQYAVDNCSKMAYVDINGTKWKVKNVEIKFPRLLLSIGGVYNG